eukprot:988057-Pelagomonas_calceolata.AAC.1
MASVQQFLTSEIPEKMQHAQQVDRLRMHSLQEPNLGWYILSIARGTVPEVTSLERFRIPSNQTLRGVFMSITFSDFHSKSYRRVCTELSSEAGAENAAKEKS